MINTRTLYRQLFACLFCSFFCWQQASAAEDLGTVEFKEATVGDAIRVISELAEVNIVVTEAARDNVVSFYLKDATVESAIDSLCRVSGLWYRKSVEFNIFYVMTEEEFNQDIIVEKEFITEIFELKHQNVSDAAYAVESLFGTRVILREPVENPSYLLEGDIGGGSSGNGSSGSNGNSNNNSNRNNNNNNNNRINLLGGSGSSSGNDTEIEARRSFFDESDLNNIDQIFVDEAELVRNNIRREPPIYVTWNYLHNLLMIRTSDNLALEDISSLISFIDIPAPQVLLEMQILRATLGDEERSIFDYSYQQGQVQTGVDENNNPEFSARNILGLGNFPLEGGAFLAQISGSELSATVEWLRTQNRINLVAQPNIIAANNKEAKLTIGEDRVIILGASSDIVTTQSGSVLNVQFDAENRIIGTELSIWPRINDDKTVTLDIIQSNTSLNVASTNIPISTASGSVTNVAIDSVSESTIELTTIARHGATIAIGGMIDTEQQEFNEQVPFLGDIPILGKAFRKDFTTNVRSELVILITPWISYNPGSAYEENQERVSTWSEHPELNSFLSVPTGDHELTNWPLATQQKALAIIRQAMADKKLNPSFGLNCQNGNTSSRSRFSDWHITDALTVDALEHCQTEGLFLTRTRIYNHSNQVQDLRPNIFNQGWVASQGESLSLQPGESSILYLISGIQSEELLQLSQEAFYYGEGAINAF